MRRVWMAAVAAALLLGVAVPAMAQQPTFTVTFSGEMRIIGYVWDNMIDFRDTQGTAFKDSQSRYFQRWRLFTTVQSADKKAKVVWAVEVGDLTWGTGSSPSGNEFGGPPNPQPSSAGRGAGAGLGADGVNLETKNLYLQFDIPFIPNANLLVGAANNVFLSSPTFAFVDDDAFMVQFNWKADPVDLQVYTAKIDENTLQNADDNDMYVARIGVNVTKDLRLTVEGMVVDQKCLRAPGSGGPCVGVDFGDNFWVGATVGAKIGTISLDGTVVYGQRTLLCSGVGCAGQATAEETGFGAQLTARVPFGPVNTWFHGWYTTGDENRPLPAATNGTLTADSDKLPLPIAGASWGSAPFVAEFITGNRTTGAPAIGQPLYLDPTGLYGVGASAIYALTPALSLAGGLAYVGVTEEARVGKSAPFGDNAVEIDAGAIYTYNANLSFQLVGAYVIADKDDDAWGVIYRMRFAF